jgi:hypothetical protein
LRYSANALRVGQGKGQVPVVAHQAFADLAMAITLGPWRLYANFDTPLVVAGRSGVADGYAFTAPDLNPGTRPDTFTDVRLGADVCFFGRPGSPLRLGAGAQLLLTIGANGDRADYTTDGTSRFMLRGLVAGDLGRYFTYAGHLGVHVRALIDAAPGTPKGQELLFGLAGGVRLPVGASGSWAVVVGPEIYGASAFRGFFSGDATALEALVSTRIEGTRRDRVQLRVKLAAGGGLNARFGAPEWRVLLGVEAFTRNLRQGQD